ncbi:glutamate--tRNA ligase [Aureimonas frigidaquae]|uniref:Glutamate--tRNA ligase n=1 Tax=Aureimonas frigidaquae TaxID=424757 RepID=A0A0P0Z2J8_9HYPH|nr:glutamate--tRNA ligase [Aureimonas frigidaquae]BAT28238.1 glutamyl-tRNA synthetase [Aureimonas frigidaquae]
MTLTVRFAPSPTGYIHIGNLRPALFNWLYAKERSGAAQGRFVLRYDDTDAGRSTRAFADAIAQDLEWIGIVPDLVVRQSERIALYDRAAATLKAKGLLYPCYETPDELERKRKRQMARGLPPVYGRDALRLTEGERAALEAEGRRPHWRFLLPNFKGDPFAPQRTDIGWNDLVRGPLTVDLASLSDPVLMREDGTYLYTLPSVVDDGELGISHIIRGDDHVTNSGVQIALFEALDYAVPTLGHHNLLTTIDGEGLSKRSGALSIRTLRQDGYEPMAIASLAVLVGAAGAIEPMGDLAALGARLDLAAISASNAKFDPAELDRLNAELVHALPTERVAGQLADMGVPSEEADAFWLAVRGNCAKVADAAQWARIVFDAPDRAELGGDDAAFLAQAFDLLPDGPLGPQSWQAWTGAVKAATGRKGRALFAPLRLALTGRDHGPELAALLPLIGRERVLARRP